MELTKDRLRKIIKEEMKAVGIGVGGGDIEQDDELDFVNSVESAALSRLSGDNDNV
jgi:hypothetical protein